MKFKIRYCSCRDCDTSFVFSVKQQEEFSFKGFAAPTRCPECHERRTGRRKNRGGGKKLVIAAICTSCGQKAIIPFRPSAKKPVYCDGCFEARKAASPQSRPEGQQMNETFIATGFAQFPLDARLQRAIAAEGYTDPTPVQDAAIPVALTGRDLIGAAQTGTGKTAAFVLPVLQRLLTSPGPKVETRAVILTPTRELAEQIVDAIRKLSQFTKICVAAVYGGVNISPQMRALRGGASIIVACPGRLLDHINRGTADFSNVDMLVLDEADRMLDMGFLPHVKRILGYMPKERQTMLFSATFAPELNRLVAGELNNPERIEIDFSTPPATISHVLYPCTASQKSSLLRALLDQTHAQSVLIFTRTKHRANDLAAQVEAAGYSTTALHSNKSQFQRQRALNDFRSGRCQILVATDIAARGLDINTISHVINYDIPDTSEAYIHRIGRTGRATREGDALTLVAPQDYGIVREIEKALGKPIERRKLDDFQYKEEARTARPASKKTQKKAFPYTDPKSTFSKPRRSKTGFVDSK